MALRPFSFLRAGFDYSNHFTTLTVAWPDERCLLTCLTSLLVRNLPTRLESRGEGSMAGSNRRFTLAAIALPFLFLAMSGLARANDIFVNTLDGGSPGLSAVHAGGCGHRGQHAPVLNGCGAGNGTDGYCSLSPARSSPMTPASCRSHFGHHRSDLRLLGRRSMRHYDRRRNHPSDLRR